MSHVDVISDVLAAAVRAYPDSEFVQSLSHQYLVRGSLSKRQLEGLRAKAQRIKNLPPAKLATLEAIIRKRHKKYKSEAPLSVPLVEEDNASEQTVSAILEKYPQHKRVLFFQAKLQNHETLTPTEQAELAKFHKLLIK